MILKKLQEKQFDFILREKRNIEVVDESLAEFDYHLMNITKTKLVA